MATTADAMWLGMHGTGTVYRVDPQTNRVVAKVTFPGQAASAIASTGGSVWVGRCKFGDTGVVRIDPATNAVAMTIEGPSACGVAIDADAVWVTDTTHDSVWRISSRTNTVVAKIPLGAGSFPQAIATGFGAVWIANSANGTVARIDPATNAVVATVRAGATPPSGSHAGIESITAGGGAVWIGNDVDDKLYRIDPATNAVTALDVGAVDRGDWRAFDVSYGNGSVWARTASCEAAAVDPATGTVTKRLVLCSPPLQFTSSIAFAFGSLWTAYPDSGAVRRIQP